MPSEQTQGVKIRARNREHAQEKARNGRCEIAALCSVAEVGQAISHGVIWVQAKAGSLSAVIRLPHHIVPPDSRIEQHAEHFA